MAKPQWKDVRSLRAISFACYDTLVDADGSLWAQLEGATVLDNFVGDRDEFLAWCRTRREQLQAAAYRSHHELLGAVLHEGLRRFGVKIDEQSALRLADRCWLWTAYEDVASALRRIGSRWPLYLISNGEHLVLRRTIERVGIPFAEIVGSDDVRSYKPAGQHFQEILRRHDAPPDTLCHVAAIPERDLVPAAEAGIGTAWLIRDPARSKAPLSVGLKVDGMEALAEAFGV